ncbi:MAG: glutamyl-tRNA reductase [Vicinamibacterales bacterium]
MAGQTSSGHATAVEAVPAPAAWPTDAASGLETLRALTLNHRTVGLHALSDASVGADHAAALHARLHEAGVASVVLATCNRTELYWQARTPDDDRIVLDAFAATVRACVVPHFFRGDAAAEHLFRVCSGLESLVLGEAEILGQVRSALDICGHAGPFLTGVVRAALRTGRAARAETAIGVGATSVASASVKLLATHLRLAESRVLVVGAGATGLKVARQLRALGVKALVLANRTRERAAAQAGLVDAESVGLDDLAREVAAADAVVGAAAAPDVLVTEAMLAAAVSARGGGLLVTVDLSMPPVIAAPDLAGLVRLDLPAIDRHVAREHDKRAGEIPKVDAVVARELAFLRTWARQQALRPLFASLRRTVEGLRPAELTRVQDVLGVARGTDATTLDRLSRRLLDRMTASSECGRQASNAGEREFLRRLLASGRPPS